MKALILYALLIIAAIHGIRLAAPGWHEIQSTKGLAADRIEALLQIGGSR